MGELGVIALLEWSNELVVISPVKNHIKSSNGVCGSTIYSHI